MVGLQFRFRCRALVGLKSCVPSGVALGKGTLWGFSWVGEAGSWRLSHGVKKSDTAIIVTVSELGSGVMYLVSTLNPACTNAGLTAEVMRL